MKERYGEGQRDNQRIDSKAFPHILKRDIRCPLGILKGLLRAQVISKTMDKSLKNSCFSAFFG
jgi:hypothetical protein